MKSSQFRRNITIIFSTFFIVILVYLFYAEVYMRSREEKLIRTRFRVLDQLGDNLESKIKSYQNNAINYEKAMRDILDSNDSIKKKIKNLNISGKNKTDLSKEEQELLDERQNLNNALSDYKKVFNPDFQNVRLIDAGSNKDPVTIKKDTVIFNCEKYAFYLPFEFLLKNIDRKDVFEKALIIFDDSTIYSTLGDDLRLVLYNPPEKKDKKEGFSINLRRNTPGDTLYLPIGKELKSAGIHSNQCYDIKLSDGRYKLFLKPLSFGNLDLFVGGMVSNQEFQYKKQSVVPWIIIVLSLFLLLIMLSLPFVKLKVMSRTEMLGSGSVIYMGLAFLIGATFLIHFIFFQAFYISRVDDIDENLEDLSSEIKKSLAGELDSIVGQFGRVKQIYPDKRSNINKFETNIFKDPSAWNLGLYDYFDYIFWLDSNGNATYEITPFSFEESLLNYSYRDYFKKYNEWYWSGSKSGEKSKFRMESIVSSTSGDHKAALSMPYDTLGAHVMVLTGRFYSIIDPIIPYGFKFCIIDETGKVWFNSNKYLNMAENFISECENDRFLKAALYADVSKPIDVNYYNNPHRIFIDRLHPDIPLYLITLHDQRVGYAQQAQVFITILILISGLFIFILLQVIMMMILKRFSGIVKTSGKFKFDLINMRKSKTREYKRLLLFFGFSFLIFCIFILPQPDVLAILSILILITAVFTKLYIDLHDFNTNSWAYKAILVINGIILLVVLYFLLSNVRSSQDIFHWLFLAFMAASFLIFIIEDDWIDKRIKIRLDAAFSMVILSIVILFGVLPVLKFFDIAVKLEDQVSIRFNQVELASVREARNDEYFKYYQRIESPKGNVDHYRDQAHRNRKEKGLYTDFWLQTKFMDGAAFDHDTFGLKRASSVYHQIPDELLLRIKQFRPGYIDDISVTSKYLLADEESMKSFLWIGNTKNNTTYLEYQSPTEDISRKSKVTRYIKSTLNAISIFNPFLRSWKEKSAIEKVFHLVKEFSLYFLAVIILFLLFRLVLWTTRMVFGLGLMRFNGPETFHSTIQENLDQGRSVLLVNPSSFTVYKDLEAKLKSDYPAEDFKWVDPTVNVTPKCWLVNGFLSDYQDAGSFRTRLNTIMKWLETSEKLIILLETNPYNVLKYYQEKADSLKTPDPKSDKKTDSSTDPTSIVHDLLKSLIYRLPIIYIPVKYPDKNATAIKEQRRDINEETNAETPEQLIHAETQASDYLVHIKEHLDNFLVELRVDEWQDSVIKRRLLSRIIDLADRYYQSLLEPCTPEEKFVLLDLAFDNLANIKNKSVISRLIKRGLLIRGPDNVELMNESFQIFLVSTYSMHDKLQFKKAMGVGPSDWTGYRFAIIMVIVALFIFIFISNQDFLNNLNKLFITLGASIAGISTILGLMGKKGKE